MQVVRRAIHVLAAAASVVGDTDVARRGEIQDRGACHWGGLYTRPRGTWKTFDWAVDGFAGD
jgi:hypothetical protein